jgi:DNA polymerase-3 subunit delta'
MTGDRFRTRGQPSALAAMEQMLHAGVPHALLLAGPSGVGKRTLADDLAAALLCVAPDSDARPDRTCRACRALEHGNHPDLHRLGPTGPGQVIPIGGRDDRGVRDLVRELALQPVEGGLRVAIVGDADRMTDDAQAAFLKTLEEPPVGTVLILTAADEERLLPTIRSRVSRIRLGPVPRADVEAILVGAGLADAPTSARLARLAGGRPGDAVAMARSPEAVTIRAEIARTLLDLTGATRADRLRLGRDLLARAGALVAATRVGALGAGGADDGVGGRKATGRGRKAGAPAASSAAGAATASGGATASGADGRDAIDGPSATGGGTAARIPASERRSAALALLAIWRDVARDLALVVMGDPQSVKAIDLLDDLESTGAGLPAVFAAAQLRRLDAAGERLEGNVSPELVIDALALGWVARVAA